MSNLYVPNGAWLVCTSGMSTQQLSVTSQTSVKMTGGQLMATVEDKVKTDFGCKNMATRLAAFAGILAAIVAAAVLIAATGGLGLGVLLAIGVAGAAGAIGGGALGRMLPCLCAMSMGKWTEYQPLVKIGGHYALLDKSIASCSGGGMVKIMYSKEAAEAFAALVSRKSDMEIANIAGVLFVAPFVIKGAVTGIAGFASGFSAALSVNGLAAAAFTGEALVVGGVGFGVGEVMAFVKDEIYDTFGVDDYVGGRIEGQTDATLNNQPITKETERGNQQGLYTAVEFTEGMENAQNRKGSITNLKGITYERKGYLSSDKGYIQEHAMDEVLDKNDYKFRIEGKRNVIKNLSETDKLTQSNGAYYMNEEYNQITQKDYNVGKGMIKELKGQFNPLKHISLTELFTDLYRGIGNKLLEGKLNDYQKTLGAEAKARADVAVTTR